jgi:coenzyme F420-reducing hydrogenase delta subunit
VDPQHVLKAFARGADGVLILGCRPGECHYREGNLHALKRVALLRRLLEPLGVAPERLALAWVAAGEGRKYAEVVRGMVEALRRLGPLGGQEGPRRESFG